MNHSSSLSSLPHPETEPRHNAHSLRTREGNEVQFMRPQRSVVEQSRHFLTGSRW
ncbi:hypothetical protein R3W88_016118 [Solanum pinnatisectum]|uniref:Uncharacterized protein n=1 Tax=Solanum pinnatisectum TaxID=50273 RepID=A0AAV9KYV7_9SOLN|nr:hypothetical protein R3W88_016118 [Solanum pinnatisectum]